MNEEQAVLEFFSKEENLPLGLSVANLMDDIRARMNSEFWRQLSLALENSLQEQPFSWQILPTEDKNDDTQLVGLHFNPPFEQEVFLRPMIEQQLMGGGWRIYFGLIWSTTPSTEHLNLPSVCRLKETLSNTGMKSNESFLAWQWTKLHPRRQDFLLRLSQHPDALLEEAMKPLNSLLTDFGSALDEANSALRIAPRSMAISLDQLRSKRPSK